METLSDEESHKESFYDSDSTVTFDISEDTILTKSSDLNEGEIS